MKKSTFIILLLLLSSFAIAPSSPVTYIIEEVLVTTNSQPTIYVDYEEEVILKTFTLESNVKPYEIINLTDDNKNFNFTPIKHLSNGLYNLTVEVSDFVGNTLIVIQPIKIDAPLMDIFVSDPVRGFSNKTVFNATINTSEPANCRFQIKTSEIRKFEEMPFEFNTHTNPLLQTTEHLFINAQEKIPAYSQIEYFFIKCNDSNGIIDTGEFYLAYDITPPDLSATLQPSLIIDPEIPESVLTVRSDDKTICTYNDLEFSDFDPDNISAYKEVHEVTLDFRYILNLPREQRYNVAKFYYNISCTNLAGFETSILNKELIVDLEEEFDIYLIKPSPFDVDKSFSYTDSDDFDFQIATTIRTDNCEFVDSDPLTSFDTVSVEKIYTKSFTNMDEGTNTFKVKCDNPEGFKEKTFTVIVDTKKPENLTVDIVDPTCSLSSVTGSISADDDEGIDFFNYTISKGNDILVTDQTSGTISETILMEDGETYNLNVVAYDNAGNFVQGTTTFKAINSSAIVCDFTDPTTRLTKTVTDTGVLVNISCQDSGSGCKDRFDYGLSAEDDPCMITQGHDLDREITLSQSQNICWKVFDNNDNYVSDWKFITYNPDEATLPDHCLNEVQDEDEVNIDCGGESCLPCETGSACENNTDCITNSCDPDTSICVEASCENSYSDGNETDVDCGGDCDTRCELNSSCEYSADCDSGFCIETICLEDPDKDSDGDGMPDRWEDLYTLDKNDPTDADGDIDEDGYSNLEEYLAGTNPLDYESKPSEDDTDYFDDDVDDATTETSSGMLGWILIIIGLILALGGAAYLATKKTITGEAAFEPRLIKEKGQIMPEAERAEEETIEFGGDEGVATEIFKKVLEKKKEKRSRLVDEFETGDEDKKETIKPLKTVDVKPKPVLKKKVETQSSKATSAPEGKPLSETASTITPITKREEFVDLSNIEDKKLESKDAKGDVFQELDIISKKGDKQVSKPKESIIKKEGEKPEAEEDIFDQLPLSVEKKKEAQSSEATSVTESKDSGTQKPKVSVVTKTKSFRNTEQSSVMPKGKLLSETVEKEQKEDISNMSDDDIFSQLADMTQQDDKEVKKIVDKDEVSSADLVKVFANVTSSKQIDANVFKTILSQLLSKGKLSKQTVAEILFEFLDNELLSNKEVADIMKEMGMHK